MVLYYTLESLSGAAQNRGITKSTIAPGASPPWRRCAPFVALTFAGTVVAFLPSLGGTMRLQTGRHLEALTDFDRAVLLQPENGAVRVGRGQTRLLLGDGPGAAEDFERALRTRPPNGA